MANKTFTIITICLNNEKEINKTMKSVLMQKEVNIAYIIKCGNSTDKTNSIIKDIIKKTQMIQVGCGNDIL